MDSYDGCTNVISSQSPKPMEKYIWLLKTGKLTVVL